MGGIGRGEMVHLRWTTALSGENQDLRPVRMECITLAVECKVKDKASAEDTPSFSISGDFAFAARQLF